MGHSQNQNPQNCGFESSKAMKRYYNGKQSNQIFLFYKVQLRDH